jgi:hypothetical protein
MPVVSEIPQASALQQQLEQILKAIDALDIGGATVPTITIMPGPPIDPTVPGAYQMSIGLTLTPPITDDETLDTLRQALLNQSEVVQQKLVDMGYVDNVSMNYGKHARAQEEVQEEEMELSR